MRSISHHHKCIMGRYRICIVAFCSSSCLYSTEETAERRGSAPLSPPARLIESNPANCFNEPVKHTVRCLIIHHFNAACVCMVYRTLYRHCISNRSHKPWSINEAVMKVEIQHRVAGKSQSTPSKCNPAIHRNLGDTQPGWRGPVPHILSGILVS